MSEISSVNNASGLRVRRVSVDPAYASQSGAEEVRGRGGARSSDRVELSRVAQYLSQLQAEPAERTDLINRVREEIEAGTYLSDDKLEQAADQLLDDINLDI
ncbi:MAG: flagellar biosynthesis anti-sigma factor FlgM [bacterium]|nr:flagellar biosynthesis anti-sigma factor FlgM [bacterium]